LIFYEENETGNYMHFYNLIAILTFFEKHGEKHSLGSGTCYDLGDRDLPSLIFTSLVPWNLRDSSRLENYLYNSFITMNMSL
jgi:hypothetical protein